MGIKRKTRVLVVDDSVFFRNLISKALSEDEWIDVIDTTGDAVSAAEKVVSLKPDVITLDIEMPKMDGIEFLKRVMPEYPVPTVVVSSLGDKVFEALKAGAVDFVSKVEGGTDSGFNSFINELKIKIKIASIAKVGYWKNKQAQNSEPVAKKVDSGCKIIAIGASTGGTEALYELIKGFTRDMPGAVVVQHMPPGFTKLYAARLNNTCSVEVKEAETNDKIYPGRVLIAPGDFHMTIKKSGSQFSIDCLRGEKVNGHCPSVDVLFNSVAEIAGKSAIGVILTGMGGDGAKGLLKMRGNMARTIGQNEKTCIVYGMPKVAFDMKAVEMQLPLENITGMIKDMLKQF